MMYTVVALVYLISAGVPVDEPLPFMSKHTFVGLEPCQDYLKSEAFAAERISLYRTVGQAVAIKALKDESAQVPSVAITASCQEDNRL
jgi:hypothetical protein